MNSNEDQKSIINCIFNNDEVNVEEIKKLLRNPTEKSSLDRAYAWLLFVNILPRNMNDWRQIRNDIYKTYDDFKEMFQLSSWHKMRLSELVKNEKYNIPNEKLMELIHNDTIRTIQQIYFLVPEYDEDYVCESQIHCKFTRTMRRIERILYIFASLNKTISYYQGFNFILTVIIYVFSSAIDIFDNDMNKVEAMSFRFFQCLMTSTSLNEMFIYASDASVNALKEFDTIASKYSKRYLSLMELNIDSVCYAYKWLSLLFTQEFDIPSVLEIWDYILTHLENLKIYISCIAVALIELNENEIDNSDFSVTLFNIQNCKISNIYTLLKYAEKLYDIIEKS